MRRTREMNERQQFYRRCRREKMKISKGVQTTFDEFVAANEAHIVLYAKLKDGVSLEEAMKMLHCINDDIARKAAPTPNKDASVSKYAVDKYRNFAFLSPHLCFEQEGAMWAPLIPWAIPDIFEADTFILGSCLVFMDWKAIKLANASRFLPELQLVKKISKGKYLMKWKDVDQVNSLETTRRELNGAIATRKRSYTDVANAVQAYRAAKTKYKEDLKAEKRLCYWEGQE